MKPVTIVGAGFSGLTLAYYLRSLGIPVQIFEKSPGPGGLIATRHEAKGLVETAANALLADKNVEELFAALNLQFATRIKSRHRRFIFWKRPSRWPLTLWTSLKLLKLKFTTPTPLANETVEGWAKRLVNGEFLDRLLAPALRGVYAGDPQRLSANLVLRSLFGGGVTRGRLRGSVAPVGGMGQLIHALENRLKNDGVVFNYGRDFKLESPPENPTVICSSAWAAAEIVAPVAPVWAQLLRRVEALPLITATAFFSPRENDLQGFGCLFPEEERFQALGVLFNTSIFSDRSRDRSETWIFGGAGREAVMSISDEEIQRSILTDRSRLPGATDQPLAITVTRWPQALPHYTTSWEQTLSELKPQPPLFLHGNYMGALGLARILERSKKLAQEIKDQYGS